MSKRDIHIFMLTLSASLILTLETAAQTYLSEITVEVQHQEGELKDLVSELEGNTGFTFAYLDKSLQNKPIKLDRTSWQMDDLLKEVSAQVKVSYKRVNGSIAILSEKEKSLEELKVTDQKVNWSVNGSILGVGDFGLSYANVLLLNANDSSIIKGAVTDNQGHYSIAHVDPGEYFIQSYNVGMSKNTSDVFQVTNQDVFLSPIRLTESVRELDGVTIEADKPLFEQRIDRFIVNVENSPIMTGSTAAEVLQMVPGVIFSPATYRIDINGRNGVMLMINGKLTRMSGQALMTYLESTPTQLIERIEIISSPPASYDAEGNAGFINIVMKRNDKKGTHGSVNVMMGHSRKEKFITSVAINNRTEKLNVFGNLTHHHDQTSFHHTMRRENDYLEDYVVASSKMNRVGGYDLTSARLGLDYYLSETTTFGILGDFYLRDYKALIGVKSHYDFEIGIDTISGSLRRNLDKKVQSAINFNIHHQFDSKQNIEINLDYLDFANNQEDHYDNEYSPQNEGTMLIEEIFINRNFPVRFWIGAMDYRLQIDNSTFFEMGIKATKNELTNDVNTDRLYGEVFVDDTEFTFYTDMYEEILAAYGSLNTSIGKTTIKSGIRYEHTNTLIRGERELPIVERSYGNFFPSVFLSRAFTDKSSITLSYDTRISRPSFYQLSPGQKFIEPRLFSTGNTLLRPSRSNTIQASWTLNQLITSIEYSRIDKAIGSIPIQKEGMIFFSNLNYDKTELIGMKLTFPLILADWWEMNNVIGYFNKSVSTPLDNQVHQLSIKYGIGSSTQRFKLSNQLSAELFASYRSGNVSDFEVRKSRSEIAIGVSKKIGESGGTLSLNVSDVFRTMNARSKIVVPESNMVLWQTFDWDTRVFRISYTNTFGNNKIKSRSKRKGGAEEELKRL